MCGLLVGDLHTPLGLTRLELRDEARPRDSPVFRLHREVRPGSHDVVRVRHKGWGGGVADHPQFQKKLF